MDLLFVHDESLVNHDSGCNQANYPVLLKMGSYSSTRMYHYWDNFLIY